MANTISRSLHDLGLAAWFGGTLANAVALNTAAAEASSDKDSGAVANAGWDRWTPVNAAAIGAHVVGSVGQLIGNRSRLAGQSGVGTMSIVKSALTAAALGLTGWSRVAGSKVSKASNPAVKDATTSTTGTPRDVAEAQKQLSILQWAIPAVTGALIVVSSFAGEQQRPVSALAGALRRVTS